MKIKEIDRTANVAWSPVEVDPVYLAVGTAAQQLDSSFSTNATLELYQFDTNQSGLDLPVKATLPCESRFHKLIWGSHGISGDKGEHPMGIIVGGCDGGVMQVYDAAKVLKNDNPLVLTKTKHTGAVRALDFNPFRSNLVASGASESEIFIWDLTNPKTPMTPGTKVQPADDVSHLAWNKQVEHILASTFSTRCVVWDLRKNEPVIKVSDTTSRIRYKVVEWHPEVATQMCLASEDDNNPVIQLWDLRYATAPLKVIQGHQRGILGMAWCSQDPDLLLTCGKEARILCWNPNFPHPGYEMVCDIPTSSQYSFDVSFCPKNPVVIASSSYDGRVSIFGLSGGVQHPMTSSKLADSFPGMDMTLSAPLPSQQPPFLQLRDAPKWLKRPCGASFGFGGKLVSFTNTKVAPVQPGQTPTVTSKVSVLQLVTLPNFIERSKRLEETLQCGSLEGYCAQKAVEFNGSSEAQIWDFLQANFSEHPRQEYLSKLGFNAYEIITRLDNRVPDLTLNGVIDEFEALGRRAPDGYANGYEFGPGRRGSTAKAEKELKVPIDDNSVDGKINQVLLCGNIDVAVNLCIEDERWADALLLASKATPETLMKVQNKYFEKCQSEATQMIRAVVTHDLGKLVDRCSLDSWKQVLAVITTYADNKEFPILADKLGQRLQSSQVESQKLGALLCCICSGNLNHLVDVWISDSDKHDNTPDELQDLVEQIMILKKAGEMWGRENNVDGRSVASKLIQYSGLLASQGCLELALRFLGDCNDPEVELFKERLYLSLRSPRPIKTQRQTRSRQTSESSMRSSFTKRPSYPNTNLGSSRPIFNSSEFDNLTGPVHPPQQPSYLSNNSQQSAYGNVYVNPNVPQTVGQYSPPSQYGSASVGLPPRVPSSTMTGSIYTPAEFPRSSMMMPPANDPAPARTPLGSSIPHPPVSSAAHGWNDPPPMKASNKPKPTPTTLASTIQPITHPIFGSAAPPEPDYGLDPYGNSQMMPPPRQQQTMYSPSSTSYGQPSNSGYSPPQSSNFGLPPSQMGPPPTMSQSPYYSSASGQSSFGQPISQSFGPPTTSQQQAFGQPPPTSQSFPPPPASQSFGQSPPTSQSPLRKSSSPQIAFPPPPLHTSQVGYRASTPVQSAFASPPTAQTLSGPPPLIPPMILPPGFSPPAQIGAPPLIPPMVLPPGFSPPAQIGPQPLIPPMILPPGFSPPAQMGAPPLIPPMILPPGFSPPAQMGPPPMNYFGDPSMEPPQFSNNNAVSNSSPFAIPHYNSVIEACNAPQFLPNPASTFQPINPPAPTPPPPSKVAEAQKPLGPIPPEHAILVDTLEKLRSECYDVAHLIQMKRKLEDVARKLDAFTEKLRNGSLTESTLFTLHSLVDAIGAKDYQQALQIHTQLVSAGNFAEISTFLPAIKVLIQSATQLSV